VPSVVVCATHGTPYDSSWRETNLAHTSSELSPQQRAERYTIRIANFGGDPIPAGITGLKADALRVPHASPGSKIAAICRAPFEDGALGCAHSCPRAPCRITQGETLSQAAPRPKARTLYQRIAVCHMVGNDEAGLRNTGFDHR